MKTKRTYGIVAAAVAAALGLAGCDGMPMKNDSGGYGQPAAPTGQTQEVSLSGKNEVPPNDSAATGKATVWVGADGSVKVQLAVSGMAATAAHIHMGASGANGGVIVPLDKSGDNAFASKPDAKFTPEQLAAFKAGQTYLNVHSAKLPGGELRAQLKGS